SGGHCASNDDVGFSFRVRFNFCQVRRGRAGVADSALRMRIWGLAKRLTTMSEAFERERQNNDSLAALQSKVSQLRHVTVDIYDQARDQGVIDSTSETFSTMTTSLKGSARRLGTMASQGNKVAILKLAGIVVGVCVLLYWICHWLFF
ncbi:hypothetical protein D0867_07842, partial [Hortaea werneckii]